MDFPAFDTLPLLAQFLLLAVTAYRITRIVTTDKWPPSKLLRNTVIARFGPESAWAEYIHCGWCAGTLITAGVLFTQTFIPPVALTVITFGATAMTIVGLLSSHED